MKKLFIGLLIIAAAGAGIYFLLRKQKQPHTETKFQQELIIGDWKLDSLSLPDSENLNVLVLLDSNLLKYHYAFTKENRVYVSLHDSLTADSSSFAWTNQNDLVFENDLFNKAPDSLNVTLLTADSLVLLDRDSSLLFFTKRKP